MKAVKAPAVRRTDDESWREVALCREVDPELFWPEPGGNVTDGLRICSRCDAQQECLIYAMSIHPPVPGIWGMTTERQRRGLRRGDGTAEAA